MHRYRASSRRWGMVSRSSRSGGVYDRSRHDQGRTGDLEYPGEAEMRVDQAAAQRADERAEEGCTAGQPKCAATMLGRDVRSNEGVRQWNDTCQEQTCEESFGYER